MMILFQFKQIKEAKNRCATKIGTDSVLLGAWASVVGNPFSILDVGAIPGVIALMLTR
ncbi:hypothetical protein [Hyunsoonleella rubra]|uniref:Uncharacterized protein n=1 Tax=Hyunsoonleella rubra TaxID=1737062 RepID=A0ABW5T740_9FLAO